MWKQIAGMLFGTAANLIFKKVLIAVIGIACIGAGYGLYSVVKTYTDSKANKVIIGQQQLIIKQQAAEIVKKDESKAAENTRIIKHGAEIKKIEAKTDDLLHKTDTAVIEIKADPAKTAQEKEQATAVVYTDSIWTQYCETVGGDHPSCKKPIT